MFHSPTVEHYLVGRLMVNLLRLFYIDFDHNEAIKCKYENIKVLCPNISYHYCLFLTLTSAHEDSMSLVML